MLLYYNSPAIASNLMGHVGDDIDIGMFCSFAIQMVLGTHAHSSEQQVLSWRWSGTTPSRRSRRHRDGKQWQTEFAGRGHQHEVCASCGGASSKGVFGCGSAIVCPVMGDLSPREGGDSMRSNARGKLITASGGAKGGSSLVVGHPKRKDPQHDQKQAKLPRSRHHYEIATGANYKQIANITGKPRLVARHHPDR